MTSPEPRETYSAADVKKFSDALTDALPNDPVAALNMIAWTFANIVISTDCDDATAIAALQKALNRLRGQRH